MIVKLLIFASIFCSFAPTAFAADKSHFEVAGWVPYWRVATGTADVLSHLGAFTEVSPFGFNVKKDGGVFDPMHILGPEWSTVIAGARADKVKIIPTVMWSDTKSIYKVLKSPTLRREHEAQIVNIVSAFKFDGVDIDYEGKSAETKNYFSAFLRELSQKLPKGKLLSCTIEARTPSDAAFDKAPKYFGYANDLARINTYCDRVRIMTYDQGRIDLRLNASTTGMYNPISDSRWVEKVITLMSKTISKKKIFIGVPTYGHEYAVSNQGNNNTDYHFITSFDQNYALGLAQAFNITPTRNPAGELSFAYTPTTTPSIIGGQTLPHFLSWSDAGAIADKVALAKRLGVRGVAIFKIDGGEDGAMWNVLK